MDLENLVCILLIVIVYMQAFLDCSLQVLVCQSLVEFFLTVSSAAYRALNAGLASLSAVGANRTSSAVVANCSSSSVVRNHVLGHNIHNHMHVR